MVNPYLNVREMDEAEKQRREAAMYGVADPEADQIVVQFKPHPGRDRDRTVIAHGDQPG